LRVSGLGRLATRTALVLALFAGTAHAKPTASGYRGHVQRWHEKAPGASAPVDESGRPKLVLEAINVRERVELVASADDGGFSEADQERARLILRDTHADQMGTLDPALLDLLYRIQRHFDAPCIRVISAYRSPSGRKTSQHTRGSAADIVVPGVKDHVLAKFVRSLSKTGVGLYPRSGFVHVDVRERSHHWVDGSGPSLRKASAKKKRKKPAKRRATKKKSKRRATGKATPKGG